MILSVAAQNVRSLAQVRYEFSPGVNVISGPNGCGKTSVLEAVHLLSQGFSFRARDLKEMVAWNADELVLRGDFETEGRAMGRGVQVGRGRTVARENGETVRSIASFFGTAPAVVMQPSDIELLRGAPEVRRHWLDEILCYRSPANASLLRRYKRVLQQRNQWLKQFKQSGCATGGDDLFRVLTAQLVDLGAKLWVARLDLSAEISPVITDYYRSLSGGVDEITCNYKSSILKDLDALDAAVFMDDSEIESVAAVAPADSAPADSAPADSATAAGPDSQMGASADENMLRNAFANKLSGLEFVEKLQGVTMAGPHKDDLALCASGYEMRSVGSQGQCRSAAVAMRFAAVDVAARYAARPILLLDDIFAELDVNRRDAVAALIREKNCQVLIATPQAEELPFAADAEFHMELKR